MVPSHASRPRSIAGRTHDRVVPGPRSPANGHNAAADVARARPVISLRTAPGAIRSDRQSNVQHATPHTTARPSGHRQNTWEHLATQNLMRRSKARLLDPHFQVYTPSRNVHPPLLRVSARFAQFSRTQQTPPSPVPDTDLFRDPDTLARFPNPESHSQHPVAADRALPEIPLRQAVFAR